MAKKKETLTPRQRQSQRIMREKKIRKRRQTLLRKLAIIGGAVGILALSGGSIWLWKSGVAARTTQAAVDGVYQLTVRGGFSVQSLYLDGRSRTPMSEIEQALMIKKGDPILRISLDDVRERLEHISSVRFATVERELPNSLYIHIVEREPVALWQNQGKLALVDDNGVVMNDLNIAAYQRLPLIVGDDAPAQVNELLAMLSSEEGLAKRFAAAVRVGGRRWNIRLTDGVEVKLPEDNPQEAWKRLAQLEHDQKLLDRDVRVIDLRVDGKLFIKVTPQEMQTKAQSAKET